MSEKSDVEKSRLIEMERKMWQTRDKGGSLVKSGLLVPPMKGIIASENENKSSTEFLSFF